MTSNEMVLRALCRLVALGVVLWSAIDAFGTLHGFGVFSAVWLLMPSQVSHD